MTLDERSIITILMGIMAGIAIASQNTLSARAEPIAGPLPTGILVNMGGGFVGFFILLFLIYGSQSVTWQSAFQVVHLTTLGGSIGILIVAGASYSIARAGVTAGSAAILFGQLALAIIIDTTGIGRDEPIPLSPPRIAGLILLMIAAILLLPRDG